jgi:hypothetical protein
MSPSVAPSLAPELLGALSQTDLPARLGRALPLVTVDAAGRPHPMLLSYVEVLALAPDAIRVAIGAGSGSARNLEQRCAATLLVVEPERTVYVKCRAHGPPLVSGGLARFALRVEEVREDSAAEWEQGARITSGILYGPALPLEAAEVQATLSLLRQADPPAG